MGWTQNFSVGNQLLCVFSLVTNESVLYLLQVIAILDKIKDENVKKGTIDDDLDLGEADNRNGEVEWEGDDFDDEDIIYVK